MTSPESYFTPDQIDFLHIIVEQEVEFMVVGGTAVAYHGYPRNMKDLDLFVSNSKQNVKKLFHSIDVFFENIHPDIGDYEDFVGSDKVLRFGRGRSRTELLFSIDAISFDEAKENCDTFSLKNVKIPIIGYEDLIEKKKSSGREQDRADVEQLRKISNQGKNEASDEK